MDSFHKNNNDIIEQFTYNNGNIRSLEEVKADGKRMLSESTFRTRYARCKQDGTLESWEDAVDRVMDMHDEQVDKLMVAKSEKFLEKKIEDEEDLTTRVKNILLNARKQLYQKILEGLNIILYHMVLVSIVKNVWQDPIEIEAAQLGELHLSGFLQGRRRDNIRFIS